MNKRYLQILLVVLNGAIILSPRLIFQPLVAQGDHGLNLYTIAAAGRGEIPYHDFWWPYGPLMLYYYAILFKFFGTSIATVLLGVAILNLLSGILIYLTLLCFAPFLIAFIGAMWFLMFNPGFFHTYNHYGGTTLELLLVFMLVRYQYTARERYLWIGSLCVWALLFVKLNIGLAGWMGFLISVLFINQLQGYPSCSRRLYLWTTFGIPAVTAAVYCLLVAGMPSYAIAQCFPYFEGEQFPLTSIALNLWEWFRVTFLLSNPIDRIMAVILAVCGMKASIVFRNKRFDAAFYREVIAVLVIFLIFYFLNLNEFLLSRIHYRMSWADPFTFLLMFAAMGFCFRQYKRSELIVLSLPLFIILAAYFQLSLVRVSTVKLPQQYFEMERGGILAKNPEPWFTTVRETMAFLKKHLKNGEKFWAIPYEPLYYFLTDTKSPTPLLMAYKYVGIPLEQEKRVIAALENEHVNYILASSQVDARNPVLGVFGEDHCRILFQYIKDNFESIAIYGNWSEEPDWAAHHGTMILKRKESRSDP